MSSALILSELSSDVKWSQSFGKFETGKFHGGSKRIQEDPNRSDSYLALIQSLSYSRKGSKRGIISASNAEQSIDLSTNVITEVKIKAFQVSLGFVRYFCPVKQIIVTLGQQLENFSVDV